MDIEILNLFHQGFTECQIAVKLGISYSEVMYVLDSYFDSLWFDNYYYEDEYVEW